MAWNGEIHPFPHDFGTPHSPQSPFFVSMQSFNMSQDRLFLFRLVCRRFCPLAAINFTPAACQPLLFIYLSVAVRCVRFIRSLACVGQRCQTNLPLAGNRCFCIRPNHLVIDWPRSIWFINGPKMPMAGLPSFCLGAATRNERTASKCNNKPNKKPKQCPIWSNQSNSCNSSNIETLTCSNFKQVAGFDDGATI